jgi:hypothetical protein
MLFLDFEHEVGHAKQLQCLGNNAPPTERVVEVVDGNGRVRFKPSKVNDGVLNNNQNAVTEYHNRLEEYLRLVERGAGPDLLREHAEGVADWRRRAPVSRPALSSEPPFPVDQTVLWRLGRPRRKI